MKLKLNETVVINGQPLTKQYIQSLSYQQRQDLVEPIFDFFRKYGFPQPDKKDQLKKEYKRLVDVIFDLNSDEIFNNSNIGNYICHHFCWDIFYKSTEKKQKSVYDVFHDDNLLKKVIFNRLGGDWLLDDGKGKGVNEAFRLTPKQMITGPRSMRLAPAISIFKPNVAKFMYLKYSNENDTVLDYSAGWGGRLLGATSCNRKYIGIDPLTTESLEKMVEYFDFKDVKLIKNCSENVILNENSIDFSFSSPPYFNQEVYSDNSNQAYNKGEDYFYNIYWAHTLKNIKFALKPNKWFGLNITDKYPKMLEMAKGEFGNVVEIIKLRTVRSHLTKNAGIEKFEPIYMFKNSK